MDNIKLKCPVCGELVNGKKEPFASYRAVALHIAAKIKTSSDEHKIWAYENSGKVEIDNAINIAKKTNGINIIGDLLLLPVKMWHDEKNKPNIGFKK